VLSHGQVSTSNLEKVRRIKNRLVRLTTRVQTLREMLEKLLDDDSDMHAMHLTARALDQLERQVPPSNCSACVPVLQSPVLESRG
jgi:hypothetical protein